MSALPASGSDMGDPEQGAPESVDRSSPDDTSSVSRNSGTGATLDPAVTARWRELQTVARAADPFCEAEFVVELARALGWKVEPVFVESDGSQAAALLVHRRRGLLSQVVVPPFCPYSAVLLPDASEPRTRASLFSGILEAARRLSPDATIVLSPDNLELASLELRAPWSSDTVQTYRSETGPMDRVIGQWSSSTRRTFRRSRDKYEPVSDMDIVPDILEFVEGAYARHDRALPIPRAGLYDLALSMIAAGNARVLGVRSRETGDVEAGVVMLSNADCAWYWIAGSKPGPAMTVCVGHILADCHTRGIRLFDFMGANTPSIAEFKRRFGGELIDYRIFETPRRPLIRLANHVRRMLPGGGAA